MKDNDEAAAYTKGCMPLKAEKPRACMKNEERRKQKPERRRRNKRASAERTAASALHFAPHCIPAACITAHLRFWRHLRSLNGYLSVYSTPPHGCGRAYQVKSFRHQSGVWWMVERYSWCVA